MSRTYKIALILAVCALHTTPLYAGKGSDEFMIAGYGVGMKKSCAAFVRETDEKDVGRYMTQAGKNWHPEHRLYLEWLSGFLTAHSYMTDGKNISGDKDANDLLTWLRNYCEKNPLDTFLVATHSLFEELQATKQKKK